MPLDLLYHHHHHPLTTPLPYTNTSLYPLQPTRLLLPLLQSPSNPLFSQRPGPADHRSIARRPTTIAAHCLRLLISPAINATSCSHEHTIRWAHTSELVWALQCPHQLAGPPAQRNHQSLPLPPPPYPQPDETAALAAVSAIRNQRHHNRAPVKK
jgi:hypothetical protein